MKKSEQFIIKWLDNPKLSEQNWWLNWLELSEEDKAHYFYEAMLKMNPSGKLGNWEGVAERQEILAAGLAEQAQRRGKTIKDQVLEWAQHARIRVERRIAGKVAGMPLSKDDAAIYYAIIDKKLAQYENNLSLS